MSTEKTKQCGCHITWRSDDPIVFKAIEFCPMHEAASDMLEALKLRAIHLPHEPGEMPDDCKLCAAIAKAEGGAR